ncbi:MAG TPA: ATP-binding protein [Longimicrobiales bacterium]|nr:ATP-binding protein [Longimicrobiales bacterium]
MKRGIPAPDLSAVNPAARIAAVYLVLSAVWIIWSDRVVAGFAGDAATLTRLQTFKGWLFVLAMAGLVYFLTRRELRTRRAAAEGQRRDEARLRLLEAEVRQAQKMETVGRLAGGVAHDFNNVLTVILGCAESLLDGLDPADVDRRIEVEELQRATVHSRGMVRQLLAFSRRRAIEAEDVEVDRRIRETTSLLRCTIPSRITVTLDLAADTAWTRMGAGQLDQVIMNLAVNARDAITGRGEITVSTRTEQPGDARVGPLAALPDGPCLRISVADTGHGIPGAIRDRIFDPFFTTKPEGVGTGLGLAMVFATIQQAGGAVTFDSTPGRGTTFHVFLPLSAPPAAPAEAPASAGGAAERPAGGTERVLVVEDEPGVRALAARVLRRHGYTVLVARDGEEALELLGLNGVDLVVTDTHMPRMDGLELLDRLPGRAPGARALLISGDSQLDTPCPAGVAFLEKPYTARVLATRVREVLDGVA